jgi:hypothetical protein
MSDMKKLCIFPIIFLLSIAMSQTNKLGTQVDEGWYDKNAPLYQTPEIVSLLTQGEGLPLNSAGTDFTDAKFRLQFPPLQFRAWVAPDRSIVMTNPSVEEAREKKYAGIADSYCAVSGEAGFSEQLIIQAVRRLENTTENRALKEAVVKSGRDDMLYLTYQERTNLRPESTVSAVAISGNLRIPADQVESVVTIFADNTFTTFYRANFKIQKLIDSLAISQGKVTFQHGWKKSDFCSFDLNKLP